MLGWRAVAAGEATELSGRGDDTVARDNDRDGVSSAGLSYGARRSCKEFCGVAITSRFTEWNGHHVGPHFLLKFGHGWRKWQVKGCTLVIEVCVELHLRFFKEGGIVYRPPIKFANVQSDNHSLVLNNFKRTNWALY